MQTATSKFTSKFQATIPEPVRKLLHLNAGNAIAFDIENNHIQIRKAEPIDLAFAQALEDALNERESSADEETYRDL